MPTLKFAVTHDQLVHGIQASARARMVPLTSAQLDECIAKVMSGITPCCRAAFDEDDVEPRGRKRGEGPRYCANCGEEVFRV